MSREYIVNRIMLAYLDIVSNLYECIAYCQIVNGAQFEHFM